MQTYSNLKTARILEIGSYDVNGTLRDFALDSTDYVGIDMEAGPGVDIVVKHGDAYPFEAGTFDLVMASSVFEHDPAFWITFVEMCRVTKPGGYIYINAPSNGLYHRYPLDHWRFYPDAGRALASWATTQLQNVRLIESFVVDHDGEIFNDFVAVFQKEPFKGKLPKTFIYEKIPCSNITIHNSEEVLNMREHPQDMLIIEEERKKQFDLINEISHKNDYINIILENAKLSNINIDNMSEELQIERRNVAALSSQIEAVESSHALEVSAIMRDASERAAEFAIDIARLENILAQRRNEIEQAWSNMDTVSKERDAALSELESSKTLNDKFSEKLTEANDWVLTLAGERKNLERSLSRLQRELTVSDNAQKLILTNLETQIHDKANLKNQLNQLKASADEARDSFEKKVSLLEAHVEETKSRADLLEAHVEKTTSRADQLDKSVRAISQELSVVNGSLEGVSNSLGDRFRELATVTVLLRQEEEAGRAHAERTDWLRQVNAILMSMPRSWGLMSKLQRRKRVLNLLKENGLFDAEAYLARNTDVLERRMDPLVHYIQHGIAEGRSI